MALIIFFLERSRKQREAALIAGKEETANAAKTDEEEWVIVGEDKAKTANATANPDKIN